MRADGLVHCRPRNAASEEGVEDSASSLALAVLGALILNPVEPVSSNVHAMPKYGDPAPWMPSVISRIRSLYAPGWGGLQRLPV